MNISEPVSSAISGVDFGFLSSEEIRALSVKRVTNPITFDTLLNPIPGGLYDAAFGNFGDNSCTTCKLKFGCPGHCGHIELPVHVYHPTFMDQCLRLLRAKCVYCHKLKMSRAEVNRFKCKLELIRYGLVKECYELDGITLQGLKKGEVVARDDSEDSDEADQDSLEITRKRDAYVAKVVKRAEAARRRGEFSESKTEMVATERRNVVKEFLFAINKGKKCASCGGISPAYRKDRFVKIFKKALTEKDRTAMIQAGRKEQDPIVLLKKQREAAIKLDKKRGLEQDEGVADLEDSPIESSEGEGDDIEMLDIEHEVAGGTTLESAAKAKRKNDPEQGFMNAGQVHAALVQLFEQEQEILGLVYSPRSRTRKGRALSADMFFIKDIVVPPNKYRPEARTGQDEIAESPDNSHYKSIMSICDVMGQIHKELNGAAVDSGRRVRTYADFQNAWVQLQNAVNTMIDKDRSPLQGNAGRRVEDGIKQRLEKKEGLFRKNMMGKRVNFAARTVISPDPNIETNEIGVPPVFAVKLTYPEPVTDWNFIELKEAVMNGPNVWPGAVAVEDENGRVVNLQIKNQEERVAIANQLQAPSNTNGSGFRNKKVHRHLNNGDIVIMNRQPTLHKPSMMCHRARVLPGEKTLRMHYANCNTYNADFDGDEMNLHFPQNEVARAEAIHIADTDHQYLSGTAGKPLRGLIQDHISMGVALTSKDTLFTREEYHQLIYTAIRPEHGHSLTGRVETVTPAILKPRPLWTGKQIITTVLKNITPQDQPGITLDGRSTTDKKLWGSEGQEQDVIFQEGQLLQGIMDKAQIGPSGGGFVNSVYEAYGHVVCGRLLSILGRVLTMLLSMRAHSCGVEDLVFTRQGDAARKEVLKGAEGLGLEVAAKYVSLEDRKPKSDDSELRRRLEDVLRDDVKQIGLDGMVNSASKDLSSEVTKQCLPAALVKPFPKNQMQAMTGSGAKGSGVNANQISCNLGQQVLEGRRVPIMVSGKTLPCFKPFESSIRAGGYIVDRFLTGVRPQEYFFHAMAGREGLIDTAVKTSRSGYLQRCLCKGLEGLKVEYDTTVRDVDGTVTQFLYGEDGLDVAKAKYLNDFKFMGENYVAFGQALNVRESHEMIKEDAVEYLKKSEKKYRRTNNLGASDPALLVYPPASNAGSISEKVYRKSQDWLDDRENKIIISKKKTGGKVSKSSFQRILQMRYLKSLVESGEAVGVMAGQSVGEPSTQMTLNTFHLAGHAAKNVTLGIPRLREIVMTASASIPTPTMTLYPRPETSRAAGEQFAKSISRLSLAEVLDKVTVTESMGQGIAYDQAKTYTVKLDFFPSDEYCKEYAIEVEDVVRTLELKFLPRLQAVIRKELKKKGDEKSLKGKSDAHPEIGQSSGAIDQEVARAEADAEGGLDDSDNEGDDDATKDKMKNNKSQGGYGAADDDEQDIVDQNRREASPEESETEDETYGGSPASSIAGDSDAEKKLSKKEIIANNASRREQRIKSARATSDVASFSFNDKTGATCTFTLEYAATTAKLLMLHLVESAARDALIQSIDGLGSCTYTVERSGKEETHTIQTEGQNLVTLREFQDTIDVNRMFTNDIAAVLRHYGVEACRSSIVREIGAVFAGHGISVDYRHLSLIADHMTRSGGYVALNRRGMTDDVSPFKKMSFETTVGFLRDAVLEEDYDDLKNPSARIVAGKVGRIGTGAFDVYTPLRMTRQNLSKRSEAEDMIVEAVEEDEDEDEKSEDGDVEMDEA